MKKIRTILLLGLSVAIFLSAAVIPAAASERGTETRVLQPESYLGRLENETGILLEDDVAMQEAVPSSRFMFSMSASGVTDLLTTYRTTKKFTRSDLNGGALYITGTLNNSTGQRDATSKVGACIYDSRLLTFDAITSDYFAPGTKETTGRYQYSIFKNGETYYGYIKNHYHYGEISGSISFYCLSSDVEVQNLNENFIQ